MKNILVFFFLLNVSCGQGQQAQEKAVQEQFDILYYQSPTGWQKSSTGETLSFSKEGDKDNYCVITLCKSVEAGADAQSNFSLSWETMAMNNLGAGTATMQPGTSDNGWQTRMGSAPFEKDGLNGTVILINSSKNNRMVNILILTNTDTFQKEMEDFLESVTLKQNSATEDKATVSATPTTSGNSKSKPGLWSLTRYISWDVADPLAMQRTITDYYVIYPNGDYYPNVPHEGLANFDKSYHPESWGRFTMNESKGKFKSKYNDIAVTKRSANKMDRDGYTASFHKCLDVDGLRIEGAYTHVAPNWGKDPKLNYLDEPGCQAVIYFKKDGTFTDRGIFSTLYGAGYANNCPGGNGTYNIENFTIIFKYSDGRVVTRLFSAPPTRNPKNFDEVYYLGGAAYYKKK